MYKNNKNIKRLISLVLVLLLLPAYAGAFTNESALELQSLGIVDTVPFNELRLGSAITRAEFAKVITKMLGYSDISAATGDGYFVDVPGEHWAASYINLSASLGLFEGYDDGRFCPEKNILLQDAVKTIVTLLGYKVSAEKQGYPQGYISVALSLKLLKGVSGALEDVASRSDVFQLVYNALDVDRLTVSLSTNGSQSYEVTSGDTIRNILMGHLDVFEGTGVVTATFEAYLVEAISSIENDEVEIDGTRYKIGNSDANNYLGVKVDFAAYEDKNTGEYILEYVLPSRDVNVLEINSEEFYGYSKNIVDFKLENDKHSDKAVISESAPILYNSRPITDWTQFEIKNGKIKLIDNNDDNIYDVVLISDYISLPVKSVDENEMLIKFKDTVLYKGVNSILFDVSDDDIRNVLYNAEGELISLGDIEEETLISIFADGNSQYMKIVAGSDKVTGVITEMFDEGCTIDGVSYKYEIKDFLSEDKIRPGDEVALYLNFEGKIGYIELIESGNERYGYIIGTETKGLSDVTVYIATAGKMEKRVDNLDNDPESNNTVTILVSKNSNVEKLKLAKRYTIKDQYGDSIRTNDKSKIPQSEIVKFRTNGEGELSEIIYPEILDYASDKTYNARDNVFGKGSGTPFGIDEDTVVLCIPESDVDSLDDYLAEVEMENAQQYKVCGYDFNQSNSNVKLLVIEEAMKYENSGSIGVNTSIAIVQKVSYIRNDDGIYVPRLVLLTKELGVELNKTIDVASYANEEKISKLKIGDVIYYSQNSRRELVDYNSVISLSGEVNYTNRGEGTDNEVIYGRACSMLPNQIDVLMNRRAYSLVIQTDEYNLSKTRTIYPHTTNPPPVFIYNKSDKQVYFGNLDSIRTEEIAAGRYDNVFVHLKNNTVQGIVLVRDSATGGND